MDSHNYNGKRRKGGGGMIGKCKHIWEMIVANVLGYSIYECKKCKMQTDDMSELPKESIIKAVKDD